MFDGLGEWARTVFSNQMALVGPPSDPARIRGLTDAAEAFERIARTRSPFRATRYPTDERVCWMPAGRHNRTAVLPLG